MPSSLNKHALCQTLRTLSGYKADDIPDDPLVLLEDITDENLIRLPCDPHNVFVVPDRIPIFVDIKKSPKNSSLLRQLYDRYADTGLVVDALISGKDSVFLVHLATSLDEVTRWVRGMNPENASLTIKTTDDEHLLIIVSMLSYVFPKNDS